MSTSPVISRTAAPAATTDVREHNLVLVLNEIRRSQPTSRTAVARQTGLAGGSLTSIVPDLVSLGLVRESQLPDARRGRPTTWLEIDGTSLAVIAVEIRIDEVLLASTDLGARPIREERVAHSHASLPSPEELTETVSRIAQSEFDRLSADGLSCVGVALIMPAPLIGAPPVVMTSTDFGWEDSVDLVAMVAARTTIPPPLFSIYSDAAVAASAEYEALGPSDPGTLLYIKADTGVGGALIIDGVPFRGGKGVGFTPGHVVVQPDGALCTCGRHGCLVAEVGPEATVAAAGLGELIGRDGLHSAFNEVLDRARSGERLAAISMARASRYLQRFTLDLTVTFDPDQIIFGGLWADAFDLLRPGDGWDMHVPRLLADSRLNPPGGAFVIPSHHGERAALIGAINEMITRLMKRPSHLGPLRPDRARQRPSQAPRSSGEASLRSGLLDEHPVA